MVTQTRATGSPCAPGETPREIYRPGDVVRMRVERELPPFLKAILSSTDGPAQLILVGVLHETTLHGHIVKYRLQGGHLIDPALVIRTHPESAAGEAAADDAGEIRAEPVASEQGIVWNLRNDLPGFESACGRFLLIEDKDITLARDTWTEEEASGNFLQANEWCDGRLVGRPLIWKPENARPNASLVALWKGREFRVMSTADDRWFASDCAFPSPIPLRQSPWFSTAEQAKEWASIRAACNVLGGEIGQPLALRYFEDIPF